MQARPLSEASMQTASFPARLIVVMFMCTRFIILLCTLSFGVSKVFLLVCLKINTFIQQGCSSYDLAVHQRILIKNQANCGNVTTKIFRRITVLNIDNNTKCFLRTKSAY